MRTYPPITINEIDLEQLPAGNNLLQSPFWGRFKEKQGWKPLAFCYDWEGREGYLLVLIRKLFRFLPIAYVPFGPELPKEDKERLLTALSWELIASLPMGTLFIRYDINQGVSLDALEARKNPLEEEAKPRLNPPLKKALQDVQPPDTVILDLEPSVENLLAGMHKKWRYNIRLADKKKVEVSVNEAPDLEEWYRMYKVTSERDRIALHPQSYYQRLFDQAREFRDKGLPAPRLFLLEARHEGQLLAGIILSLFGDRATYLYGASSNEKRNLMPSYALQWKAVELAKTEGCREYDFFGIPPTGDKNHPMHGLFLFKTGFGGRVQHNLGAWDYPYSRVFYLLYRLAEGIRLWFYKKFRKRGIR